MNTQIILTKVLEIEMHVFEHHSKRLDGNPFQSHDVWVMQIVEESYFFIEELLFFLIEHLQHFFNDNGTGAPNENIVQNH